jgi:hypothetical protein
MWSKVIALANPRMLLLNSIGSEFGGCENEEVECGKVPGKAIELE